MTRGQEPRAPFTLPVWIIAFSLLLIALCMVLDLLLKERAAPASRNADRTELPPESVAPADSPRATERPPRAARPAPATTTNAKEAADSRAEDTVVPPTSLAATIRSETGKPSTSDGGGFAPLSQLTRAGNGEVAGRVVVLEGKPGSEPDSLPGVADVVVFVSEGLGPGPYPAGTNLVDLYFTNSTIRPAISAACIGQLIRVSDYSITAHQLETLSSKNPAPPLRLQAGQRRNRLHFREAEFFVPLRCSVHPEEIAQISVFRHPFFAVTDSQGNFRIPNVPPGKYLFQAASTNAVTGAHLPVEAGRVSQVTFMLPQPRTAKAE